MDGQPVHVPLELGFKVMTSLLPRNPHAIIPAAHDATQLLVTFSLVSLATHGVAVQKLKPHCIYIDSDQRLSRFLLCHKESLKSTVDLPSPFRDIPALYLAPFELFYYTSNSLQRLIVDILFQVIYGPLEHWNRVGQVLREGFAQLTELEEFVSIRDATRFVMKSHPGEERPLAQQWPNLKRLGLHDPDCFREFWQCIAGMPNLEHAVIALPLRVLSVWTYVNDFMALFQQRTEWPVTVVFAQNQQLDLDLPWLNKLTPPTAVGEEEMVRVMACQMPKLEGSVMAYYMPKFKDPFM
ncbi:Uu.00g012620.m01.CDS01 [Anthostomella pinea]|uniref:Uu.00g012620.m01.CDS01 n=1 Tax=Anthostomella pinea TaxID=933095 RepID=A0AAI8YQ61_9PEZI|nr:Uu.00g012620.m01.CDS01 [Anthostomella pinea]